MLSDADYNCVEAVVSVTNIGVAIRIQQAQAMPLPDPQVRIFRTCARRFDRSVGAICRHCVPRQLYIVLTSFICSPTFCLSTFVLIFSTGDITHERGQGPWSGYAGVSADGEGGDRVLLDLCEPMNGLE